MQPCRSAARYCRRLSATSNLRARPSHPVENPSTASVCDLQVAQLTPTAGLVRSNLTLPGCSQPRQSLPYRYQQLSLRAAQCLGNSVLTICSMAEVAAVSAITGILSFGLQICNGLVEYYSSYRDSDDAVHSMLDAASELTKTLALISSRLADIGEIPEDTRSKVEECVFACHRSLGKFQKKLDKVKAEPAGSSPAEAMSQNKNSKWEAKFNRAQRRFLYSFKESTIIKLKELCNDCRNELQVALKILSIDLTMSTLSKIDDLSIQVVEVTDGVHNNKAAIQQMWDGVSTVVHHQKSQVTLQAIEWLSPLQGVFQKRQHEFFNVKGRQDRCGKHLIETAAFQKWTSELGQVLWCVGAPGIGKTVTASYIVNHLQHLTDQGTIGIAYVYCSYKDTQRETAVNLLSTIVQQLLLQSFANVVGVLDLFQGHAKQKTRPALSEVQDLLRVSLRGFNRTYVVVDALDECTDIDENRETFVTELTSLLPNISLLLVSRPLPHLKSRLANATQIELQAHDEDIIEYVKERVALSQRMHSHMQKDPKILQTIISKVLKKVKGMFLMARLYLDSLISLSTLRRVKESLDTLPDGLAEVYSDCLGRIRSQSSEDATLANRTLYWIVHAVRPLTVREMQCALAIRPGDLTLDEDGEPDKDLLISVCAGIVVIEKSTETITLVHYTAQDFLLNNPGQLLEEWQLDLAQTCIRHLLFSEFDSGPDTNDTDLEDKLVTYPLLRYAARYWSTHIHRCTTFMSSETIGTILDLLQQQPRVEIIYQISQIPEITLPGYSQIFTKGASGLCLASSLGLVDIVSAMLDTGEDSTILETKDSEGRSALHHAIMVQNTLPKARNTTSSTLPKATSWEVQNDATSRITDHLLAAGASPTATDLSGRTPLHYAAANNQTAIMSALLAHGASSSVRAIDGYNGTPLYRAVEAGQLAAVRMLLKLDSDVFVQNSYNQTALHRAAEENHLTMVQVLIDHVKAVKGEEEMQRWVSLKDWYGWTAMYRAADHGYTDIAKLLSAAARPAKSTSKIG